MPDFGIAEGIAALTALIGGGEAAAGGAGLLGASELAAGATGAGELGVLGTAGDFLGASGFDALAGGAGAGTGASALGTAGAFLGAADASGFGGGAALAGGLGSGALGAGAGLSGATAAAETAAGSGLAGGTGAIAGADTPITALLGATPTAGFGTQAVGLSPNVANANASASPFDVGTKPVTGLGAAGQPAGTGASAVSAPGGVTAVADPTTVAGAQGATSVGGAPLNPAPGGGSSSISDLLGKAGGGAVKSLTDNPLGVALGAGGLGYNILQGQKQTANQKALAADAVKATANSDSLVNQGQALQQYLTTGKLPDAYEQQVNNAIQDAKTRAIANAAASGQPTDPTKNSSLAATLAGIDNQRSGMVSQIAERLASSGATLINAGQAAAGLSGQLYQGLVANDTAAAKNTGAAIASLAAALNGRSQAKIGSTDISVSKAA